jgi:soluble lytic murein transglycosylase-like protein
MGRQGVIGLLLVLGVFAGPDAVLASPFRLVDEDGVVHFTNAPTDPRYRRSTGLTGTASGWLRLPAGRPNRYANEIRAAASRHGIDAGLVEALISVESTFDPWAVSRKGAQGLMQLMPSTASVLGVNDAFDPRQNIDGGVRHLRALLDRYHGDLPLALAAYNAGDEAVRWYRGIPPYPETQLYVRKILQRYGSSSHQLGNPQFIYRYQDSQGSVTYTNVPPAGGALPLR